MTTKSATAKPKASNAGIRDSCRMTARRRGACEWAISARLFGFRIAGSCLRPLHFLSGQFAKIPMKIHEYQAKEILRKYGVPVPGGEMATTLEEADTASKSLFGAGNKVVVVKAQIHAGGRGKGGGVKLAQTLEEADAAAKAILGMQLVTHQTGLPGRRCSGC